MLRVPLQPTSLLEKYDDIESNIEVIKNDRFLGEQLLIASENIYHTLMNKDFSMLSKKKQRNLVTSLSNYINRAATRTTPFGLFAGVTVLDLKDNEALMPSKIEYRKKSRIDVEWIFKLIKKIEVDHLIDLSFKMNSAAYRKGNRLYLPYNLDGKNLEIHVNYGNPLMLIEKWCTKEHVPFQKIVQILQAQYPNREIGDLIQYVKTLIEKEFIISELRPPICNTDLLMYTIDRLSKIPQLDKIYGEPLNEVHSLIHKYNNTPIGQANEIYLTIQKKLREITSFPNEKHLQVDTELCINTNIINESDIKNINDCITLFMIFASEMENSDSYQNYFIEYRLKFTEKFGTFVEVPISEVLDEVAGIGALRNYRNPSNKFSHDIPQKTEDYSLLKKFFIDKYLTAIKTNQSIVITDEDINKLKLKVNEQKLPSSLELNFIPRQNVKGENLFYLGPNIGSPAAGKTFGRFSHLNDKFSEVLEEISLNLKEKDIDQVELSFIPSAVRMANVMASNTPKDYNLSMFTNSYNTQKELTLNDILIGCDNDRFYLRNKQNGRLINISGMNMLNLSSSSNIIRILSDITLNQDLEWSDTPWGIYYKEFPYIPEIRYKNIILSNEKWSLENLRRQLKEKHNLQEFLIEFKKFKDANSVPNKVYLQFADQRILLDLTKSNDLNLLYKNLFKFPSTTLEKMEDGKAPINIHDESFSAEVVIPFILKEEYRKKNSENMISNRNSYHKVSYPPFKKWLFLKLYGSEERQTELISFLNYFILNNLDHKTYNKFFYMRYNDPKPHIRLRFHSESSENLLIIYKQLSNYIVELQEMDIIHEVEINTYFPEVNRYGGPSLIDKAEHLFYQDSLVTMELLEVMRKNNISKEQAGVISLLHYLNDFGLDFENQLSFLKVNLKNYDTYRKQFKDEEFDFVKELDSYNNWDNLGSSDLKKIIKILEHRSDSVKVYSQCIKSNEELTNDFANILGSIIHMHFNRLFEINRDFEDKLYVYAYQTLYGQRVLSKLQTV